MSFPRVTFGMIVLNGEPFLRYNLRAIYPCAHEIIVVEGAVPGSERIASPQGHSTDGTIETLLDFKKKEDPENKLVIVTAEDEGYPNGFWPGEKDEQSQAYARRASGDYLWQVDVDEFYKPGDMQLVLQVLENDPEIAAVSFKQITFWGGFDYIVDGWYLRGGAEIYHRLFKWGPGYSYTTHRPPTVLDPQGRDTRQLKWVNGDELARRGIFLYHYSLLFPKQVEEKSTYYHDAQWAKRRKAQSWAQEVFMDLRRPYFVHNVYQYPSWLERFSGQHPEQIEKMREDIKKGLVSVRVRPTEDIEQLLHSRLYRLYRAILKIQFLPICYDWLLVWRNRAKRLVQDPKCIVCRIRDFAAKAR